MRHPSPEDLFLDRPSNPRHHSTRRRAEDMDAFKKPVTVHLPDGATRKFVLKVDVDAPSSTYLGGPIYVDYKGERLWVSLLPRTVGSKDLVWTVWDPDFVLKGPPSKNAPIPGATVTWQTDAQAIMILEAADLKGDRTPADLVREVRETGRSRVRLGGGNTVVMLSPQAGSGHDLIEMRELPPRGVMPGAWYRKPTFEGAVGCKSGKNGYKPTGVALRIPELDRVGMCLFVTDVYLPKALSQGMTGGYLVPFQDVEDMRPVSALEMRAVEAMKALETITVADLWKTTDRSELTSDELHWSRTRMAAMTLSIVNASLEKSGGSRYASDISRLLAARANYGAESASCTALPYVNRLYESCDPDLDDSWSEDALVAIAMPTRVRANAAMAMADALIEDPGLRKADGTPVDYAWLAGAFLRMAREHFAEAGVRERNILSLRKPKLEKSAIAGFEQWEALAAALERSTELEPASGPTGP